MDENLKQEAAPDTATEKKTDSAKKKTKKEDKAAAELADCKKRLAEQEAQLAEMKDTHLRTVAEYDNFRRRSQKEREGVYTDAVSDCISSILPVVDNLERASAAGGDAEQVRQGLEMIAKAAEAMLAKLGVTVFGEKGDLFDPELHNAVMHIEDETLGENVIVDVYQKGYRRGDRIIRHAMVRVAN